MGEIKKGSIITTKPEENSRYVFTRDWGLYIVIEDYNQDYGKIRFKTIATTRKSLGIGSTWTEQRECFMEIDPMEWYTSHPDATIAEDFEIIIGNSVSETTTKETLCMETNDYTVSQEQLNYYKEEIMRLLPQYRYNRDLPEEHYAPTEKGVTALLNEYGKNKGWMYPYFMKHPNYIGNGKIAFSADYHRKVNKKGVKTFYDWMTQRIREWITQYEIIIGGMSYDEADMALENLRDIHNKMSNLNLCHIGQAKVNTKVNGMSMDDIKTEYFRIREIRDTYSHKGKYIGNNIFVSKEIGIKYDNYFNMLNYLNENIHMLTTQEDADVINSLTKELDLRIVKGQKISRVINKFCNKLGIDKNPEYNRKFAIFADDINELDIKRHTIISINPIDYLTMSFGNSWKSCHTIDKFNDRAVNGDGYGGCYSGGTLSYMLDGASIVYYTVDRKYDGTDFEFEPKINRCMFHIGEDKLVQGRVYPQSNDGDQTIYTEIRTIMQKVIAEMFGVDNLWILSKGTSACDSVIKTNRYAIHYPDYINFETCNVSYLKPVKNIKKITVGHEGICPKCGKSHTNHNSILCPECERNEKTCPHCGRIINEYNSSVTIDGEEYCQSCAHYCDHHERWEVDTTMRSVYRNAYVTHYGRQWDINVDIDNRFWVCVEALRENPTRYRTESTNGYIIDTNYYTRGCEVITNYRTGETKYYVSEELAKRNGFKQIHTGQWYYDDEVKYDRRTKQYYHISEWNEEYNCPTIIVNEVKAQQEMLERRAERREVRRARREAAVQSVA